MNTCTLHDLDCGLLSASTHLLTLYILNALLFRKNSSILAGIRIQHHPKGRLMQMNHWGQWKAKRKHFSSGHYIIMHPFIQYTGLLLSVKEQHLGSSHCPKQTFISSMCQESGTLLEFPHQQLGSIRDLSTLSLKSLKCLTGVSTQHPSSRLGISPFLTPACPWLLT